MRNVLVASALFTFCLYGETLYERHERYQGAQATLQLTVRDDRGVPVEGAYVQAHFWQPTSDAAAVGAYTDEKGYANVVGNGYTDVRYSVSKDGYYRTRGSARLSLPENDPTPFWKDYQWAPIIRETVIRKVRRPVSGVLHLGEWLSPPQTDVPIGLDLQLMDWMPPHGRGSHCDVVVKFVTRTLRDNGHAWEVVDSIALEFPNEHDGVLLCDAAPYSAFITPYHVPENGDFVACYRLTASEKEGTFFLPDTQTLLFRIRSKEGAGGAIVSAHYGSIFRCVMTGGMVSMDVFLSNTTPSGVWRSRMPTAGGRPRRSVLRRSGKCWRRSAWRTSSGRCGRNGAAVPARPGRKRKERRNENVCGLPLAVGSRGTLRGDAL